MSEVIADGLKLELARNGSDEILASYRQAFSGYSDDELAILDGVMLEPVAELDKAIRPEGGPYLLDTRAEG